MLRRDASLNIGFLFSLDKNVIRIRFPHNYNILNFNPVSEIHIGQVRLYIFHARIAEYPRFAVGNVIPREMKVKQNESKQSQRSKIEKSIPA